MQVTIELTPSEVTAITAFCWLRVFENAKRIALDSKDEMQAEVLLDDIEALAQPLEHIRCKLKEAILREHKQS